MTTSTDNRWLAGIPSHWDVRRNGRLFSQTKLTGRDDLPILTVSLHNGVTVRDMEDNKQQHTIEDRTKYKQVKQGDIAYNMMRMWQGAVGIAPNDGLVSPAYVTARPLADVNAKYYEYLFRTSMYMGEVERYSRGIVSDRNRLYCRVNRRGRGDATIRMVTEKEPKIKTDIDAARAATSNLFRNDMDVSPQALAEFKSTLSTDQIKAACTPEPTMVELTDILLDAWSMTSIAERMPGRPEVSPWLRGIADNLPQTTICWRAELDLFHGRPVSEKILKAIFNKHRIRTHESLTTNSFRVVEFLKKTVKLYAEILDTRIVVKLSRDFKALTLEN